MASADVLIPFILSHEAGLSREQAIRSMKDGFESIRKRAFANDPLDRGGATFAGITLATYQQYMADKKHKKVTVNDLKLITWEEWRDIFITYYWDACRATEIRNQEIANLIVDFVWASGRVGIKCVQRELGVKVDGVVGKQTLAAINAPESRGIFDQLHTARINFVRKIVEHDPRQAPFIRGWERRINNITFKGLRYE